HGSPLAGQTGAFSKLVYANPVILSRGPKTEESVSPQDRSCAERFRRVPSAPRLPQQRKMKGIAVCKLQAAIPFGRLNGLCSNIFTQTLGALHMAVPFLPALRFSGPGSLPGRTAALSSLHPFRR